MSKTKKDVGAILHSDGVSFRVWAPFAKRVAVAGSFNNWSQAPMESEGDGYWFVDIKDAQAGQEYKFVINDGHADTFKNDPRALQVTANDGNSVIVDTHFEWDGDKRQTRPLNENVIYELHVGTFNRPDPSTTGTFQDVIDKLDYLADLGVNTIELMPIASMSMDREWWGYTPEYIYAVERLYGGRYQLLEFVKAAHDRGISVILDVVYNHLGPDLKMDLWRFDGWGSEDESKGGIYFYNDWRSKTPWGQTRFDFGRSEVQQYILDNVRQWINDCHIDGLRVDSTIYIRNVEGHNDEPGTDLPDGWKLLQRINTITREIHPDALLVAEDVGYNEYITKAVTDGGAGYSSQWDENYPHVLRDTLVVINDADRNLDELCSELGRKYNGDVFQRVVYSDSHDTAANGSARLDEEIAPGNPSNIFARRRSLLAATIVLTTPGVPMLFQGQEFMQGGSFSDWKALEWDKVEQFAGIVLAYKHLIALRKNRHNNSRGLLGQSLNILHLNEGNKVLAYHRWDRGGPGDDVVVVINFTNKPQRDYEIGFPRNGSWQVRFNSDWKGYSKDFKGAGLPDVEVNDNKGKLNMAPYSAIILSQDG